MVSNIAALQFLILKLDIVARMERSAIRVDMLTPDFAALHPGYGSNKNPGIAAGVLHSCISPSY
jgi:hypothetical protein